MPKHHVLMAERVYYSTTVMADNEEQAKELALEEHSDGTDSECDNSGAEVESVRGVG